jgi:hypothetical protein
MSITNGESEDGEAKPIVDGGRSMRAVKGNLDHSLLANVWNREGDGA